LRCRQNNTIVAQSYGLSYVTSQSLHFPAHINNENETAHTEHYIVLNIFISMVLSFYHPLFFIYLNLNNNFLPKLL
jgi:hypothetical protein